MRKVGLILGSLGFLWAQRTWYFSSSGGSDGNDGATPATALRSVEVLQRLLNGQVVNGRRLSRGDTIAFLRGDTFRVVRVEGGVLRMSLSFGGAVFREEGAPIVLTAYGEGSRPLPVFTGTWRLSDSARAYIQAGPVVKVVRPFGGQDSLEVLRVFWRGQPLVPARFPNDTGLIIERTGRGTERDTIYSRGVSGLSSSFVEGARAWVSIGSDYSWGCTKVVGLEGEALVLLLLTGAEPPLQRARFFLEGKPEYVDRAGEWAYDPVGDTLYIWPEGGAFDPSEYEVMGVRVRQSDLNIGSPILFSLTRSYDLMPSDPIQGVVIEGLHFVGGADGAVRLAGVRDVVIRSCVFSHTHRSIWNFLAWDLRIEDNTFYDNENSCIVISGRMPTNQQGNPLALTRRVYVERNFIKGTGLKARWDPQLYRLDSARIVVEDYSIKVRSNIDSVIVRYNRIDSVSQGGISGLSFYYTQGDWAAAYAGSVPFIIEKNYITNFCMDFSDCGGIKVISYMNNGIVRRNILVKGADRDKSHLSSIRRVGAKGLYSDVHPHSLIWEENTVIGAYIGCGNSHGGGTIQNIKARRNTLYANRKGMDFGGVYGMSGCEVEGNTFFLGMHVPGAVEVYDTTTGNAGGVLVSLRSNTYGHPTYGPCYVYRPRAGDVEVYGFRQLGAELGYEQSPLSRWLDWVGFRAWEGAQIRRRLISNPELDATQRLPIGRFGRAQMRAVSESPFGGPAVLIWYPESEPEEASGFVLRTDESLYGDLLDSSHVYRWTVVWASNRAGDFTGNISYRYVHPNTGDTLGDRAFYSFPIFRPYQPETLRVRYEPWIQQFHTLPGIRLRRGDSVWVKRWDMEELERRSVVSLREAYPIFINPSDTVARFRLPEGWVYLTLDSVAVWGNITVGPWESKVLVRVRYDSSLVSLEGQVPVRSWAILYPNPASERVQVWLPGEARYRVMSMSGQMLSSGWWSESGSLEVASWPRGVYLVELLYAGGHREVLRLVRE